MPPSAAPECDRVGWIFEIIATSAPVSKASIAARMPAQPAPTTSTSCFAITGTTLAKREGPIAGEPSAVDARTAADRFLASPALSKSTRRAYGGDIAEFCRWLQEAGIALGALGGRVPARYVGLVGGRAGRPVPPTPGSARAPLGAFPMPPPPPRSSARSRHSRETGRSRCETVRS